MNYLETVKEVRVENAQTHTFSMMSCERSSVRVCERTAVLTVAAVSQVMFIVAS